MKQLVSDVVKQQHLEKLLKSMLLEIPLKKNLRSVCYVFAFV